MKVDLPETFISCKLVAQYLLNTAGKLAWYTVKIVDSASLYLQNLPAAYIALIGVNIVFFEVARLVCQVVNFFFNVIENYEEAQECNRCLRSLVLGTLFISITGGGNWAFYAGLRLPLSKVSMISVSIVSSVAYFFYKSY